MFIEYKRPEYICIKVIPHVSVKNYNTGTIAKIVNNTYKNFKKCIYWNNGKLIIEALPKCTYVVKLTKFNTNFYFIIPLAYRLLILQKINMVWPKATIQ